MSAALSRNRHLCPDEIIRESPIRDRQMMGKLGCQNRKTTIGEI
jgi:hypothetical protein